MAVPQWSDDFSLDNEQIDLEHQRLLELIGWLEAELKKDRDMDAESVKAVVRELNIHVQEHFAHEEALMHTLGAMPAHERQAHHDDHEHWRARIKEHLAPLLRAGTDLERRAHLARILLAVQAFWNEHFSTFDRRVGEFLAR